MAERPTLEETITFLEKAQEVARIGCWVAELASHRLLLFAGTQQTLGLHESDQITSLDDLLGFVHPDDRPAVQDAIKATLAGGPSCEIEHRIARRDGSVRWVQQKADLVPGPGGQPVRMVGTIQDITERRELEAQFRQSQKMEAIGRLAGGIAHDLNNTLTAIAGYVELALGGIAPDHAARADLEEIRRAAERAGSVTRQLLAFSRKDLFEPRLVDLNELVAGLGRLLERLLGENVRLETGLGAGIPSIIGDPGQLEQAIVNLSLNARDAMAAGGRIRLATSILEVDEAFSRTHHPMRPGRYVHLAVSDTGHGMSRETLARIFEPFFTTKGPGKGTGLGLTMVYATIKQVGGFVFVDSEPGRGTTFQIYFPPAPAATRELTQAPATVPSRAPTPGHKETVLVVEDEPAIRALVKSTLSRDGYRILVAASAAEALELAYPNLREIDLLLTDAVMPGQSGIDLANALGKERPDLPVILMSGYTEQTLDMAALDRPVSLLQKPFTPRELRQRVLDILARRT